MKIAVMGSSGQVAQSLVERAAILGFEARTFGRPIHDISKQLDISGEIPAFRPDVLVNAAAYTAVDRAETNSEAAFAINSIGAGHVADLAKVLNIPLIHISTDYVFDGELDHAYRETDITSPQSVYGLSKLQGEARVAQSACDHVILRTSWVYSPFGSNFVKTMLRLGETRDQLMVVSDQMGQPTCALDIADAILKIAIQLIAKKDQPDLRGLFHLAGTGATSWADFARFIFQTAAQHGRGPVQVQNITTEDYNAPARRPANSRLDTSKLEQVYGIRLPTWQTSASSCIIRLLQPSETS